MTREGAARTVTFLLLEKPAEVSNRRRSLPSRATTLLINDYVYNIISARCSMLLTAVHLEDVEEGGVYTAVFLHTIDWYYTLEKLASEGPRRRCGWSCSLAMHKVVHREGNARVGDNRFR